MASVASISPSLSLILFVCFCLWLRENSFVAFTPSNGSLKYQLRSLPVTRDLSIIYEHTERQGIASSQQPSTLEEEDDNGSFHFLLDHKTVAEAVTKNTSQKFVFSGCVQGRRERSAESQGTVSGWWQSMCYILGMESGEFAEGFIHAAVPNVL